MSNFALGPVENAVNTRDKLSGLAGILSSATDHLFTSMGNFRESLTSFAAQPRIYKPKRPAFSPVFNTARRVFSN